MQTDQEQPLPWWKEELKANSTRFSALWDDKDGNKGVSYERIEETSRALVEACDIVRQAGPDDVPDLTNIVNEIGNFLGEVVKTPYKHALFGVYFVASYALQEDSLIENPGERLKGGYRQSQLSCKAYDN